MKLALVIFLAVFSTACSTAVAESYHNSDELRIVGKGEKVPVLVELFTSEGCSSCPPADRALTFLQKQQPIEGVEIITLAFHVDYWDDLGWKDEFSSPLFTQRQQAYVNSFRISSGYTPQMVVDGVSEFVGSNRAKAQQKLVEAAKSPKALIEVESIENTIRTKIFNIPSHADSTLYLAIAENNLSSDVSRGENAGSKLEHVSVVRELKALAKIAPTDVNFAFDTEVDANPKWKREELSLVIFVQENKSRRILGVAKTTLR